MTQIPAMLSHVAGTSEEDSEIGRQETLLKASVLQSAIFNSANFSSIATDAKGVIQIFNVGAERARALRVELGTPITPGFEALVFKAEGPFLKATKPTTLSPKKRCIQACRRTIQQGLP